jgi:uncharacterized ParB-like nuclease family protein
MAPKKKVVYIDLNEIGVDPDRSQTREEDLNTAKMGELRGSIAKIGLQEPITVTPVTGKTHKYEVVHGCHRFRAMRDINSTDPTRFGKIPCNPPRSYSDDNEMFEEQFKENLHLDKIHTPANKQDLARHIGRLMISGTFVSPYSTSGIVWDANVFANAQSRASFQEEMEAYMEGIGCAGTAFNKVARKWVVDNIFRANGSATSARILKYTGAEAKAKLQSGIIPGFTGTSGGFEGGKIVYALNSTDGQAKVGLLIRKWVSLFGAASIKLKCRPAKVVFVAHANGKITTDKELDEERKRLTDFVKEINSFFSTQFAGNPAFSGGMIDEMYFLPQKVNRATNNETAPIKVKL